MRNSQRLVFRGLPFVLAGVILSPFLLVSTNKIAEAGLLVVGTCFVFEGLAFGVNWLGVSETAVVALRKNPSPIWSRERRWVVQFLGVCVGLIGITCVIASVRHLLT